MKSLLVLAALAAMQAGPSGGALIVELDTAASEGRVLIGLYDSEAAFDRGGAPARTIEAEPGGAVRVDGLAPGRYGIKAFHDLDGDGQMRRNPLGLPLEPYAFSNGAQPRMGPPAWRDAAFEVGAGETRQALSFR